MDKKIWTVAEIAAECKVRPLCARNWAKKLIERGKIKGQKLGTGVNSPMVYTNEEAIEIKTAIMRQTV